MMASSYFRKYILASLALMSIGAANEALAGRRFGKLRSRQTTCDHSYSGFECEPRVSCICVLYMMMNLGNGTEIYFANEHDACRTPQNCAYFDEVWYSGHNLEINENCLETNSALAKFCNAGGSQYRGSRNETEPTLDRKKPPTYDLYNDPDAISLAEGTDVVIRPIEIKEGLFRIGGSTRFARVFTMSFEKTGYPKKEFAIGIETTGLIDPLTPDFVKKATNYRDHDNLYEIELDPGQRDCLIIGAP